MAGGHGIRRYLASVTALVALGLLVGPLGQRPASAAPPTNTSKASAAPVTALPFVQEQEYTWPLPVSTDPSNKVVSTYCNNGRALHAAAWAKYTTSAAGTILARTTDNNSPRSILDDTVRNQWGIAILSGDGTRVLSCMKDTAEAQTLPVTLTPGQVVYVVRFATSKYGLNGNPEGPTIHGNLFLTSTTGAPPVNDDLASAAAITSLPYSKSVDTLLATEEDTDLRQFGCHGAGDANNTAWWSYTPTRAGLLLVSGAEYVLAQATPSGPQVVYDPGDCTGSTAQPHVQPGNRYLIQTLTPQPADVDVWGPLLVPGRPTTLRVKLQVGPSAPTGVSATTDPAARTATLRWAAPLSDGGSPLTGFRVARDGTDTGGTGPWSTVVAPSVRSLTFRFLRPWSTYKLTVQGVNADGAGPAVARTVTLTAATPNSPTAVKATRGDTKATVTWTAPTQVGNGPITAYRIRRYAGTGSTVQSTATVPATARAYTATGLTNGTAYSFDVTAFNAAGAGLVSNRSPVVTPSGLPTTS